MPKGGGGGRGGKDLRNKIAIIILIFFPKGKIPLKYFMYMCTILHSTI